MIETTLNVEAGAKRPWIGRESAGTPFVSLNSASACLTVKPFSHILGS